MATTPVSKLCMLSNCYSCNVVCLLEAHDHRMVVLRCCCAVFAVYHEHPPPECLSDRGRPHGQVHGQVNQQIHEQGSAISSYRRPCLLVGHLLSQQFVDDVMVVAGCLPAACRFLTLHVRVLLGYHNVIAVGILVLPVTFYTNYGGMDGSLIGDLCLLLHQMVDVNRDSVRLDNVSHSSHLSGESSLHYSPLSSDCSRHVHRFRVLVTSGMIQAGLCQGTSVKQQSLVFSV